jgi:sugar phosphate isomerase/epimerase
MNRRKFVFSTALLAGMPKAFKTFGNDLVPQQDTQMQNGDDMPVGVIASGNDPEKDLKIVRDLGFTVCQLNLGAFTPQLAEKLKATLSNYNIKATSLICSGPGRDVYTFTEGPATIGLVPRENRAARVERLKKGIEFCKAAGIPAIQTHFGFIPENPGDPLYKEFIDNLKPVAEHAKNNGIDIYCETGQETPVTLLRAITDVGTGNVFVNYDTANLILYGKANPVDGLKVIGKYVRSLHAKDGRYPTDPYRLGKETPIPTGDVDFPAVIASLKKLNYKGPVIIEYELAGKTSDYLLKTKAYLEKLINS